jgi:N-formylglutamate deformylase
VTLPLLLSVPHAGVRVPDEVSGYCVLTRAQIIEDGDEGAAEIYHFPDVVAQFVTTDIARAIVDVNRAEDDRRADGVVKTHTCWDVPVYEPFPPDDMVEQLLARYYRPYHERLTASSVGEVRLGVDCHTMASIGPPIGPGPGAERPAVCLSNADGACPADWIESMARCFERAFEREVAINDPFRGGYIIRAHARELPWLQVELSRAPFLSNIEKRERVIAALGEWCAAIQ